MSPPPDTNICHIVVGSGPSGIFLIHKLLNEGHDVILVERGHWIGIEDSYPQINDPLKWGASMTGMFPAIAYTTNPQQLLWGRRIVYPQGLGGGGTANVNAMILTMGHASVFDLRWPTTWSSHLMRRLSGEIINVLHPSESSSETALCSTESRSEPSDGLLDQQAIRSQYWATVTNRNTRILIRDLLTSPNVSMKGALHVMESCFVSHVSIVNGRAIGINYHENNQSSIETTFLTPRNGGEIVLCAGVFETPRILTASLQAAIPQQSAASSIGDNLQDHVVLSFICVGNHNWNIPSSSKQSGGWNGVHGWVYLDENGNIFNGEGIPHLQLLQVDGRIACDLIPEMVLPRLSVTNWIYMSFIRPVLHAILQFIISLSIVRYLCGFVFGYLVCLVNPYSRGKLTIDNQHQKYKVNIDLNFLNDRRDRDSLQKGLATARLLVKEQARDKRTSAKWFHWYFELLPGPLFQYGSTSAWFNRFCNLFASTYFHACGTCSMGSVVDEELRFRINNGGDNKEIIENLRIADASVIPAITTGPIAATCMAIGRRLGELLIEEAKMK